MNTECTTLSVIYQSTAVYLCLKKSWDELCVGKTGHLLCIEINGRKVIQQVGLGLGLGLGTGTGTDIGVCIGIRLGIDIDLGLSIDICFDNCLGLQLRIAPCLLVLPVVVVVVIVVVVVVVVVVAIFVIGVLPAAYVPYVRLNFRSKLKHNVNRQRLIELQRFIIIMRTFKMHHTFTMCVKLAGEIIWAVKPGKIISSKYRFEIRITNFLISSGCAKYTTN